MNSTGTAHEVTHDHPCPICHKPDWCFRLPDGAMVCQREDSVPPGWVKLTTKAKDGASIFRPKQNHLHPRDRTNIPSWKPTKRRDTKTSALEQEILYQYSPTQRVFRRQWSDRRPVYKDKRGNRKTKLVRPQYLDGVTWKWGKGKGPWPLYREADIQPGDAVFFVGGEACVETLRQWGFSATCNQGGEGTNIEETAKRLKNLNVRSLIIWPDNDDAGKKAADKLLNACQTIGIPTAILNPLDIHPEAPHKWDAADWTVETAQARETLSAVVANLNSSSPNCPNASNLDSAKMTPLAKMYRTIDGLWGNDFRFNELKNQIEFKGDVVDDTDDLRLTLALEHNIGVSPANCEVIIKRLAKQNSYHPVQEYLEWCAQTYGDSTTILDDMAHRYFGCTDPIYQTFLTKTLVAAVARTFNPGCKVDTAFILQGPQGYRKSSFFRTLAGDDWFDDSMGTAMSERDERLKLHQFWFVEWAELEGVLRRKDTSGVKAFLSCQVDSVRPPYGRHTISLKRRSIIVGSTNQSEFLHDVTGNRRFWVVPVKKRINLELLSQERDRIWAAAVALYRSGYSVFLSDEEETTASECNETYQSEDPWLPKIVSYLRNNHLDEVSTPELLSQALEIEPGRQNKRDQMRASDVLKSLGWSAQRKMINGVRRRLWVAPQNEPVSNAVPTTNPQTNDESDVSQSEKPLPENVTETLDSLDRSNPPKTLFSESDSYQLTFSTSIPSEAEEYYAWVEDNGSDECSGRENEWNLASR